MQFDELSRKVLAVYDLYAEENGLEVDQDYAVLKLIEEIGEFAQALIIQKGLSKVKKRLPPEKAQKAVADELADILGLTILVANRTGVDLESSLREKWFAHLE